MPEDNGARTLTLEIDGEEKQIELPEGWMHQDEIAEKYMPKESFKTELDRRVKSVTKGLVKKEDLYEDEEFLQEYLGNDAIKEKAYEVLGVEPGKPPKEVDVAELRRKIEADVATKVQDTEIKPRDSKIDVLTKQIVQMRERDFRASFISAATEIGLQDELVEPLVSFYRQQFDFSEEDNDWFKQNADGDGFELNINPDEGGKTYKTIVHVLEEERRAGKRKTWFKAPEKSGGGYQGGGRQRKTTYEEFKSMSAAQRKQLRTDDPDLFNAMLERRREEGDKALFDKQGV